MDRETKFKEAVKIGLAIVIGYYVAMRMDWMSPTWIAISIAMISLPTAGQSLQKGLLRMGGTLLAFVVGLFYLAVFPQDRWLFVIAMSPYLFFVSYKVTGRNGQYFWFVAGFVAMMITTAGPESSEHAFEFAAYRTLETLTGIVIWTLISVLVWPRSNLAALKKLSHDLVSTHEQLMGLYRSRLSGKGKQETGKDQAIQPLRDQAGKLVTQFEQTVNAAAAESYEVHEVKHLWTRLGGLAHSTIEVLDRLKSGFAEIEQTDLEKILPQTGDLFTELEARFREARDVIGGEKPSRSCEEIANPINGERAKGLDHFERAAVEVTKSELEELDGVTRAFVDCVREIEGYPAENPQAASPVKRAAVTGPLGLPPLDPDRIRGALMVTASMWVGFLLWIYLDPPGHISWYQFLPNVALVVIQIPFIRPAFAKPFAYAYTVGLTAYVFVLPQLSVFWQLGLLLFAFTFVAAFFFDGIGRAAIYLGMFNMLGIANEQNYDFASMANSFLFSMLALLLLVALSYITRSPRQEKAFVSMVRRYFRSCEFIMGRFGDRGPPSSFLGRFLWAYHCAEVRSLPAKLALWGKQIDPKKVPGVPPAQIGSLVASLQVLSFRIEDLIEARRAPQSEVLVRELTGDMREWRTVIEQACRRFSESPQPDPAKELQGKLKTRLETLNKRIEATFNTASEEEISPQESDHFYRLLGSFRGFSEAALVYAGAAEKIDWKRITEERF